MMVSILESCCALGFDMRVIDIYSKVDEDDSKEAGLNIALVNLSAAAIWAVNSVIIAVLVCREQTFACT